MATRRSSRLSKRSSLTASTASCKADPCVDDDGFCTSNSSGSDEEYKPRKKESSSESHEDDDLLAKRSATKTVRKRNREKQTSPKLAEDQKRFELDSFTINLSEGNSSDSSSDDSHRGGRQGRNTSDVAMRILASKANIGVQSSPTNGKQEESSDAKSPIIQEIKNYACATTEARRTPSLSDDDNSDVAGDEAPKADTRTPGLVSKGTPKVELHEHETPSENSQANKEVSTKSLQKTIMKMLQENEPQAGCSHTMHKGHSRSQARKNNIASKNTKADRKLERVCRASNDLGAKRRPAMQTKTSKAATSNRKHSESMEVRNLRKNNSEGVAPSKSTGGRASPSVQPLTQVSQNRKARKRLQPTDCSDSSGISDWEEVSEGEDLDSCSPSIPEGGVTITLQAASLKKKRNKFDPVADLRRRLNRARKERQLWMHQVHLLCLVAHGMQMNRILLDATLLATILSLLPSELLSFSGKLMTVVEVDRLAKLFCRLFSCKLGTTSGLGTLSADLIAAATDRLALCTRDYALLFLAILRCLGFEGRLCLSLYPAPLTVADPLKDPEKRKAFREPQCSDESDVPKIKKGKGVKGAKKVNPKPGSKKVKGGKVPQEETRTVLSKEDGHGTVDHWVEAFTPKDSKWIPVDVVHGSVGAVTEAHIGSPVLYVIGLDDAGCVKDLTKKYCQGWLTLSKNERVKASWWEDSLKPFGPPDSERERVENRQMEAKLQRQPMPSSIAEFKGHPLYVLRRHLLKYEALYPSDAPTLGFVRGEAVYARECVHVLRSREAWLREARMVRVGEQPYKTAKARPKFDKLSGRMLQRDQPLELFGRWQTEDYMPPIAFGGKVPRNEWGNVEVFKSCMLPVGTVHLRAPGLGRVAAKLQIDCVPAVVGFEGHGRGVHPVLDGWVVCEEFRETLMDAWAEEQDNLDSRYEEKRLKRIYGNWKRLIKGVLIRERLRAKYLDDN